MRFTKIFMAAYALMFTTAALAHGGGIDGPRVDDHAPIGIMADHVHKAGEWMYGLRYMNMTMDDPVNAQMGPQEMESQSVMAGLMYAPVDWVTLQAGISYQDKRMDMLMRGQTMATEADGLGDLSLNALWPIVNDGTHRFIFRTGLTLPTGKDDITNAAGMRLSQMMQPGSGAVSTNLTATYIYFADGWSLGTQAHTNLFLNDNDFDTTPGNQWHLTGWGAYNLRHDVSVSTRLSYAQIDAADNSGLDQRERTLAHFGLHYIWRGDFLKGQRIGIEFATPLDEDKGNNPLETGTSLVIGLQRSF